MTCGTCLMGVTEGRGGKEGRALAGGVRVGGGGHQSKMPSSTSQGVREMGGGRLEGGRGPEEVCALQISSDKRERLPLFASLLLKWREKKKQEEIERKKHELSGLYRCSFLCQALEINQYHLQYTQAMAILDS